MKIRYFADTDTLYIELNDHTVAETRESNENTLLDLDANGALIAITIEHTARHNRSVRVKFIAVTHVVADEAIRAHLEELDVHALEDEEHAYQRLYPELRERYPQQVVAIYSGQVVDVDPDFEALFLRIQEPYGDRTVLIRRIGDTPPRGITLPWPPVGADVMSIHAYSVAHTPPMPVCTLHLGADGEEPQIGSLEAIIDTGADIMIVPLYHLRKLGVWACLSG